MSRDANSSPEKSYRLILKHSQHPPIEGFMGRLVRILGLDIYDTSMLGCRARTEMQFIGLLLFIVFIFDLGAWTLLFNAILHSEVLALGPLTPLAVFAGFLISISILIYERQFITADTSAGLKRLLMPMGLRMAVIIASALATAQPVELLFFKEPIEQRIHEEGFRLEIIGLDAQMQELRQIRLEQAKAVGEKAPQLLEASIEDQRLTALIDERQQAEEKGSNLYKRQLELERDIQSKKGRERWLGNQIAELEKKFARASRDADNKRTALRAAERDLTYEKNRFPRNTYDISKAEEAVLQANEAFQRSESTKNASKDNLDRRRRSLASTISSRRTLERELADLEIEQKVNIRTKDNLSSQFALTDDAYKERRLAVENMLRNDVQSEKLESIRIRKWIESLRQAKPGSNDVITETVIDTNTLEQQATDKFNYNLPNYDFFEKLRILKDLREGLPPRWVGVDEQKIKEFSEKYNIQENDTAANNKRKIFKYSYYAVYAIALIIPILIIAMKLLMASELKAYYSHRYQAAARNPDAMAYVTVRDAVDDA